MVPGVTIVVTAEPKAERLEELPKSICDNADGQYILLP